jgi:hypothetical protein
MVPAGLTMISKGKRRGRVSCTSCSRGGLRRWSHRQNGRARGRAGARTRSARSPVSRQALPGSGSGLVTLPLGTAVSSTTCRGRFGGPAKRTDRPSPRRMPSKFERTVRHVSGLRYTLCKSVVDSTIQCRSFNLSRAAQLPFASQRQSRPTAFPSPAAVFHPSHGLSPRMT